MKRRLTKKEKFNIDIFYRPFLVNRRNKRTGFIFQYENNFESLSHLKILEIFSRDYLDDYFKNKDKDEFYMFLNDYEDLLNWRAIIPRALNLAVNFKDVVNFVDCFKEYFDDVSWKNTSRKYECFHNNEFLRKFKDKLDWEFITRNRWFEPEYLLEFKDYIDFNHIFEHLHVRGDFRYLVKDYGREH